MWGMWGDIAISLIQHGFQAPRVCFIRVEIPRKKWGALNISQREKQSAG